MTTPIGLFQQHLAILRDEGYSVQSADRVIDAIAVGQRIPPRTVVITFDDGFRDLYDLAAPALASYSFPSVAFVLSAALRGEEERILGGHLGGHLGAYLPAELVRELADRGLMDFGSHGEDHRPLDRQPEGTIRASLARARSDLEAVLGRPATLLAYPFGAREMWRPAPAAAAAAARFRAAFTSICGPNDAGADLYRLRRDRVSWRTGPTEFGRLLAGGYDWYANVQRIQVAFADLVQSGRSR